MIYDVRVAYNRFPIGDLGLPTPALMNGILDWIEERLQSGHKIYVHCWGGIGRTGTTVGCYLVRQGKTAEEALEQLAVWWRDVPKSHYHPHSPETPSRWISSVPGRSMMIDLKTAQMTSAISPALFKVNSTLRVNKVPDKRKYNFSWRRYSLETTQPEAQFQPEPKVEQPANWKRFVLDILETLILAVVLYFGINAVSARVRVDGFSMNPTLQDGEYILVNKLAYKTGDPHRGDIVVFVFPVNPEEDLIKRVIGLPGESVSVQDGVVTVNGVPLTEPYIASPPIYNGEWEVPEGQLFVLGDNRNESRDSHQWGLLPMENVVGRAVLIYWPPAEWQVINQMTEPCCTGSVECKMNNLQTFPRLLECIPLP